MSVERKLTAVLVLLLVLMVGALVATNRLEAREDARGPFGVGFDARPNGIEWQARAPGGFPGDVMYVVITRDGKRIGQVRIPLMTWGDRLRHGFTPYFEGLTLQEGDEVTVDIITIWGGRVDIVSGRVTVVR